MKQYGRLILFITFLAAAPLTAQLPPPPSPVIESDLRDNTIKMRAVELERIKRESEKPLIGGTTIENTSKFSQIKADFEDIQKKQDTLLRIYIKGEKIDHARIGKVAMTIRKSALRLDTNLFTAGPGKPDKISPVEEKRKSLKTLIFELDAAIGKFVRNEIFQNNKIVDTDAAERAQLGLQEIVRLSQAVALEANRIRTL